MKATGGLTEQPKREETKEENLIPGSKHISESPAMIELQNQERSPWFEVELPWEGRGRAEGSGEEVSIIAEKYFHGLRHLCAQVS